MTTAAPAPQRKARWKLVVGFLALVGAGLGGYLYVRVTVADSAPRDPASAEEGPITQLYRPAGENTQVRGAILLAHPIDKVWKEVGDLERIGAPFLRDVNVEPGPDSTKVTGQAKGIIFRWW